MNLLSVDFESIILITVGLFALSGFLRGWWREGLTTVLLIALVVLLTQPEWTSRIFESLNNTLNLVFTLINSGGTANAGTVQAAGTQTPPINLEPSNRNLYITILIAAILLSYFTSRALLPNEARPGSSFTPSLGARIAGGIIGAFNGFVVINLVTEYIIGRFVPDTGISAQATAPPVVAIQVAEIPSINVFDGAAYWLILGTGLVVLMFLGSRVADLGLHGVKTKAPVGYVEVKLEKKKEEKG